jgi:hypothetical protein
VEAWHSPEGATKRTDRTYLGRVGKRLLAEWEKGEPENRRTCVERWIAEKRQGKGIP